VSIAIAEVAILRHHVAHRADFRGGQFAFVECGPDGFGDLCLGFSSNASLVCDYSGQIRPCRRRIEANSVTGLQDSKTPDRRFPRPEDRCTIQTNPFVPLTVVW
jgi:hypothetical protein